MLHKFWLHVADVMYVLVMLFALSILVFLARECGAETPPPPVNAPFELWLGNTLDHTGITHTSEKDTVFVYVKENWKKESDEWRFKAIRRLGCAARTEYAGELKPPYNVEILLLVSRPDGSVVTETVAAGNIDQESCALNDFLPILEPTKETAL